MVLLCELLGLWPYQIHKAFKVFFLLGFFSTPSIANIVFNGDIMSFWDVLGLEVVFGFV